MKIRSLVVAAVLATAAIGIALAPTAGAATSGTTITTFAITAGGLSITVPSSTVALNTGTVNAGATSAAGQLGSVTVADTRGNLVATWTTTVSSSEFTTGTATSDEKVTLANIAYASGLTTASSGVGTFVPLLSTPMSAASTSRVVRWTVGVGNNSATWDPTLTFTLQSSQVAGTYSGTITHSVA